MVAKKSVIPKSPTGEPEVPQNAVEEIVITDNDIEQMEKDFAESYPELMVKPSKNTSIFDMLEIGNYSKLETKDFPEISILKIEDILKWIGTTEYGQTFTKENPATYIRGTLFYKQGNDKIEKSITWFPPASVITRINNLKIDKTDLIRIKNMGYVEPKNGFNGHYNMFVEKLAK